MKNKIKKLSSSNKELSPADVAFLKIINELGSETVRRMDDKSVTEFVSSKNVLSTGNIAIDIASGIMGFPRGKVVEIHGGESSGKTTVALQACAQANKQKENVLYVDFEHSLDWAYAQALGARRSRFALSQPDSAEDGYNTIFEFVDSKSVSVVVIDSVAAMTSLQSLNSELDAANIGAEARVHSRLLRRLVPKLSVNGVLLIAINQIRDNVGGYGASTITPGGRAWRFYATMRLEIKRTSTNDVKGVKVSNETKVKFIKNKAAPPYTEAGFAIEFGRGARNERSLIDIAEEYKVLEKKGSWINYKGENLAQGKDKAATLFEENTELFEEIWQAVKQKITDSRKEIKKPSRKAKDIAKEISVATQTISRRFTENEPSKIQRGIPMAESDITTDT